MKEKTIKLNLRIKKLKKMLKRGTHEKYATDSRKLTVLDEKEVENKPLIIRKALAIEKLLKNVPVFIQEDELIVGGCPVMDSPEYATDEEKNRAWNLGKVGTNTLFGHIVAGYGNVLKNGFAGLQRKAEKKVKQAKGNSEKNHFWEAVIKSCNATKMYTQRYVEEAKLQAGKTKNIKKKEELIQIAEISSRVPYYPAASFKEAIQSLWFTYSIFRILGHSIMPLGRLDQYLYPYYKKDLLENQINPEQAQELIDCLWIKYNSADYINNDYRDADNGQNVVLAGQTREGEDATNPITYMCLESNRRLKLRSPAINIRFFEGSEQKLYDKVLQLITEGVGGTKPNIYNDEIAITSLTNFGISLEDARDYCIDGCVELIIPEKAEERPIGVWIEMLKSLELALNNGFSLRRGDHAPFQTETLLKYGVIMDTGDVSGPKTGEPNGMKNFSDLMEAFKTQVSFMTARKVRECNNNSKYIPTIAPTPLLSATLFDCIEKGLDKTEGGCRYSATGTTARGAVETANSLSAIKKLVYDKKEISLEEMVKALKSNYHGYEDLQFKLKNQMPKFGNDDSEVDDIMVDISNFFFKEVAKHKNPWGGPYRPGLWTSWFTYAGKQIGASADGRKVGDPLTNNLTPVSGTALKGPTAIIKSVTKIDFTNCPNGTALDLVLDPNILKTKRDKIKLMGLIKSFLKLGGLNITFNVLNADILRKAQKEPERFKDLTVRVWGFSAYFVTLNKEYQEHVINRTK